MCEASSRLMKNLNGMIEPYGVRYYTEADSCPQLIKEKEIDNYIEYYGLFKNLKRTLSEEEKTKLINYFWDDYRTIFGREYDRILCTNSFRRLQYKTQVMVNSASDEQRTRLLHSLEVERIAKRIALGIGVNAELAANIAIAHDIGHTPFGHSGEEAISKYLSSGGNKNETCFLHAIQSVKVLDKLATHKELQKYGIDGLGLSEYVLEGVLKHDSDAFSEGIISDRLKRQYDVTRLCGIVGVEDAMPKILKSMNGSVPTNKPQVLIGSVESQIVAWADKIAYLGHDWEEFLYTKLLEKLMSRLNDMIRELFRLCDEPSMKSECEEFDELRSIKELFKDIESAYAMITINAKEIWELKVRAKLIKIIDKLNLIEDPKEGGLYFTKPEYRALKDYLAMVLSWVKLTDTYPKVYAMKYDPIFIFYGFLNEMRTTIISRAVMDKCFR